MIHGRVSGRLGWTCKTKICVPKTSLPCGVGCKGLIRTEIGPFGWELPWDGATYRRLEPSVSVFSAFEDDDTVTSGNQWYSVYLGCFQWVLN